MAATSVTQALADLEVSPNADAIVSTSPTEESANDPGQALPNGDVHEDPSGKPNGQPSCDDTKPPISPEHVLGEGVEIIPLIPPVKKPFKPTPEMKAHLADVKARTKQVATKVRVHFARALEPLRTRSDLLAEQPSGTQLDRARCPRPARHTLRAGRTQRPPALTPPPAHQVDGGEQFQAAACSVAGTSELRSGNEDRFSLVENVAEGVLMLGVYDGHGGDDTSDFLRQVR